MLPICDLPHWFLSVPATSGPSAILLHLLVVRGRDFDHFGHRRIPTDLLVRRQLFGQMQLFLEIPNDVLEFREIFRRSLDQGLVSFQHRLRPSGAVFFQQYWKSLPVLFYGAPWGSVMPIHPRGAAVAQDLDDLLGALSVGSD